MMISAQKEPTPPPPTIGKGVMVRRDSEDSLQNDEKMNRLLRSSRPSNDIMPDFQKNTEVKLSTVKKHQTPWMPGALKTTTGDQKKSNDDGTRSRDETPMSLATLQTHNNTNPSGPRTNYNVSGSAIITSASNSLQRKKTKTVRFPTTIDDGGTMGAGRRRGRYSPPPSPPRTNSGDTADMRDTLIIREGEGEATDVSELDLDGSVVEKPVPMESEGGFVGGGEEGRKRRGKSNDIDVIPAPANMINATDESKDNEEKETGRRQQPSSSEKKKRKSPTKNPPNAQPRRESPRKSSRTSPNAKSVRNK